VPRTNAEDRLRRLLALIPWVAAHDGPTVEEVCARFGLTEGELVTDLSMLPLCGLHPYTPDMLIEADIDEGRVWVRYAEYFSRPLRMTPAEALVLLAAGRTVLATPGADPDGPLARGLAKLAAALGVDTGADPVAIALARVPAAVVDAVQEALAGQRRLALRYYSFGRDTWTDREVDPYRLYSARGEWYLAAYCHEARDERLFRLDRVERATVLDETFEPPATPPGLTVYTPGVDDPRVELLLEPAGRWVLSQYPVESVEELAGGRARVRLAVAGAAWLERLLLVLGPAGGVVTGDDPGPAAAARILARYGFPASQG
jgi:proteasome accessory factor C